jgi:hypothetical protein
MMEHDGKIHEFGGSTKLKIHNPDPKCSWWVCPRMDDPNKHGNIIMV